MGLLTGNPRGATVRSQGEYTVCMRLAREPFTEVSEKWGDIMAFLRNVPLLREVMLHDEDFEMARRPPGAGQLRVSETQPRHVQRAPCGIDPVPVASTQG